MGAYFLRQLQGGSLDQPQGISSPPPLIAPPPPPPPAEEDDPTAGGDMLGRFADKLGSFGTDTGGDDRRNALRQALIQGGLSMAANAGKEGLGAVAPALLGGFQSYRGDLQKTEEGNAAAAKEAAIEEDRKARLALDKGRYQQDSADRLAAVGEKRDAAAAVIANKQAALTRHTTMLDKIKDPDLKEQLAPLAGDQTGAFERAYATAIRPENPKHNYTTVGRALIDLSGDPTKPVYRDPADKPAGEPGWQFETVGDQLIRANKLTGAAFPIDLPTGTGPTRGEKQQIQQDALRLNATHLKQLADKGVVDFEPAEVMARAQREATEMVLARRAQRPVTPPPNPGAPAAAPKASAAPARSKIDPVILEQRLRLRYVGQPESIIQQKIREARAAAGF